jgi:quercetin dioxygenase-like cupin family protein
MSYFEAPTQEPSEPGRFFQAGALPAIDMIEGLTLRPVVGTNVMVSFVRYEPGVEAPLHAHVEEQIFIALEGEFEMELGGEVRTLRPGDGALIPSWVTHRVKAGPQGGYQIDIFNPPRQGLLDRLESSG